MRPKTKTPKMRDRRADSKSTAKARRATLDRKQERAGKRAVQKGGGR